MKVEPIVDTLADTAWDYDWEAAEEAHYHFTLSEFEALLYEHGLAKLLKDMSDDSAFELLKQAAEINSVK